MAKSFWNMGRAYHYVRGAGRLVDFGGSTARRFGYVRTPRTDAEALASDWLTVLGDMDQVLLMDQDPTSTRRIPEDAQVEPAGFGRDD